MKKKQSHLEQGVNKDVPPQLLPYFQTGELTGYTLPAKRLQREVPSGVEKNVADELKKLIDYLQAPIIENKYRSGQQEDELRRKILAETKSDFLVHNKLDIDRPTVALNIVREIVELLPSIHRYHKPSRPGMSIETERRRFQAEFQAKWEQHDPKNKEKKKLLKEFDEFILGIFDSAVQVSQAEQTKKSKK